MASITVNLVNESIGGDVDTVEAPTLRNRHGEHLGIYEIQVVNHLRIVICLARTGGY